MKRYLIALLISLSSICQAQLHDEFYDRYFSISAIVNANGYWNGSSGNWSSTGIWVNGIVADGIDATAYMTNNITAAKIVTNDVARTIGAIVFTDVTAADRDLTITGTSPLTMQTSSSFPYANVTDSTRTLTISCPIAGTTGFGKWGAGTLTLTGTNTFTDTMYINNGTVIVTAEHNLGAANNDIIFGSTTANLNMNTATPITFSANKNISINTNPGAWAKFLSGNGSKIFPGQLTGTGEIVWISTTSLTFNNTNNTFTGTLTLQMDNPSYGFEAASLGDGGLVRLGTGSANGGLRWLGRTGPTEFINRQFVLVGSTGGGVIRQLNTNPTNTLTIHQPLKLETAGNKTFTLAGVNTGYNVFAGNITNGTGSVISVTKSDTGTWALSGTNTFTGALTLNNGSGKLYIWGTNAIAATTSIVMNQSSSATSYMYLLDNGSGILTIPSTLTVLNQNSSSAIGITVGNRVLANGGDISGSSTTGSTIAFNGILFDSGNTAVVGFGTLTSANSYSLQFNKTDFKATPNTANWKPRFGNGNCPIILNGNIRQLSGCTTAGRNIIFSLTGSSTANTIAGNIMNAVDYPANTNTVALAVEKVEAGTWTLSGTNTFTGDLSIVKGTLSFANTNAVPVAPVKITYSGANLGVLNLNYIGTNIVASYSTNSIALPAGNYGSNGTTITGTGFINVNVNATGGIITNYNVDGVNYRAHIFTNSGTFTTLNSGNVETLIVAGGGGGGGFAGGGGAGGLISTNFIVATSSNYVITVGSGGAGGAYPASGSNGNNSAFNSYTAIGGGGGGGRPTAATGTNGKNGGSGGGGSPSDGVLTYGGTNTTYQGYFGGNGRSPIATGNWGGGGGGGAGAIGADATGNTATASGGNGGNGLQSSISGITKYYAGGGGGGTYGNATSGTAGTGGLGGGGDGKKTDGGVAPAGTDGLGGGGGGSGYLGTGGKGGSGVVIIRYRTTGTESIPAWSPSSISPTAWYDANDSATVLRSGTSVTNWNDKSGNGYKLVSSGSNPTYVSSSINSLPAIHMSGAPSMVNLNLATQFTGEDKPFSIFYVLKNDPIVATGTTAAWKFNSTNNVYALLAGTVVISDPGQVCKLGCNIRSDYDNSVGITATNIIADLAVVLDGKTSSGADVYQWINGTQAATSSYWDGRITIDKFQVGDGVNFSGYFAEILVFNSNLSTTNRQKVEGYLAWKWGTVSSLPANHPYKNSQP